MKGVCLILDFTVKEGMEEEKLKEVLDKGWRGLITVSDVVVLGLTDDPVSDLGRLDHFRNDIWLDFKDLLGVLD